MVKFKSLFQKTGLSLDRLRNFALIADAGGLSLAAGGASSRMSLFSKQVRELEAFFGVALTVRQGRAVKLTDAGRELAQLARAHLGGLADLTVDLALIREDAVSLPLKCKRVLLMTYSVFLPRRLALAVRKAELKT